MKKLNKILFVVIAGLFAAGIASASLGEYWSTVSHIIPRTNDAVDIGSATKRVRTIYTDDLDVSGVFTLGGTVGTGGIDMNGEDLTMGDDAKLYFDTAKTHYLEHNTDHGELLIGTDTLVTPGALWIYGNTGADGSGTWEPFIEIQNGVMTFQNTNEGTAGNKYVHIHTTDGLRIRTTGNANARILADNIATSDKTFQFPNYSGTFALTDMQEGLTITNATTDNGTSIDQNGNVGTNVATDGAVHIENTENTGIGLGVYSNIGATADASLVSFQVANAAFDKELLWIYNNGVNSSLKIDQNGNAVLGALQIGGNTTQRLVDIRQGAALTAGYSTFFLYSNQVETAGGSIFELFMDNNSSTIPAMIINNDGSGKSLSTDQDVANKNWTDGSFNLTATSVVTDAGTYTKSGSIFNITSEVTETSGTITDSAIVLDINQTHADSTGNVVDIRNQGKGRSIYDDHDDTGTNPSWELDRDGNNAAAITGLKVNVANAGAGSAYAAVFETGNVGIGTTTPTAYLHLKAGTATASTAPLKLTSGTLNTTAEAGAFEYDGTNLYFSPANNDRKEIALSDTNFAEMYLYANATATVIDTADVWHALSLSEITVGCEDGWTYADGVTGSDITTYATYDGGASTLVTTTAAHNLSAGDFITITGTTNYNDIQEVLSVPSATTFEIDKAWDTNNDATGTYNRGGTLTAGANSAGIYRLEWNITITPQTNNHIFTASSLIEKTACEKCRARLRMGTAGDYGNMGTSSLVTVAAGDKIQFLIKNVGAAGNVTVRHGNLNLSRL